MQCEKTECIRKTSDYSQDRSQVRHLGQALLSVEQRDPGQCLRSSEHFKCPSIWIGCWPPRNHYMKRSDKRDISAKKVKSGKLILGSKCLRSLSGIPEEGTPNQSPTQSYIHPLIFVLLNQERLGLVMYCS